VPDACSQESDEALLERLQYGAFRYFTQFACPANGLVADTSRPESPCSIAVVGFALSCYPIAVERGWIAREDACDRTLRTLKFFARSEQSKEADATGYNGFYYHFLDMSEGRRAWECELSLIDTALLLAGVHVAALYYERDGQESTVRALAGELLARTDWSWALTDRETLAQGWKPETGFLHYGWEGYNEATILYLFAIASTTHPIPAESFARWKFSYQWENLLGIDTLYSGPLFTHLFSHAFIDFRDIQDQFMREIEFDYFRNTQNAVAIQREYAARNPRGFAAYDRNLWGITAGDGPSNEDKTLRARDRRFYGYMARGVPYGPDDGTIAPWAMLATLPFSPEAALGGTRHLLGRFPQVCQSNRFSSGFNAGTLEDERTWLSEGWYGLDQGLLVIMIENYRSGFIWNLTRGSALLHRGLKRAGFTGGWLNARS
jgi:hypothetical protein